MASGQDEVPATPRVEPLDKLTYIQEWRNRSNHTQYAPGPIQLTVIKDLYSMTIDLWRKVLLASRSSGSQHKPHNMTDDSFQTLHLWGMGHGVLDGDLDSCLQSSKELYDSVMSLLVSIAELLFYGLLSSIVPPKSPEYEVFLDSDIAGLIELSRSTLSHSEERATIADDVEDLAASLENEVECLTFLSPALTAPAPDQPGNCGQTLDYSADIPHHTRYLEIIRSKFPSAQSDLVETLAKVSWHRYQHICQQRVKEVTQDTVLVPNHDEVKSQFQDSGLGSSTHSVQVDSTGQDDAMTVMSTRAESSHKRLPSLSAEARAGEPFICEICYKLIIIKRTHDWRKHVFQDLLAYSCIFENCSSGAVLFNNSTAISAHLMSEHATQLGRCPLCREQSGDYNSSILLHFTRHMEEIALAALPPIATSDVESDDTTDSKESQTSTEKRRTIPRSHTSSHYNEAAFPYEGHNDFSQPPSLYSNQIRSPTVSSISTGLASRFSGVPLLENNNGVLERRPLVRTPVYKCTFWYLSCSYISYDQEEWKTHCLSHFRGEEPPRSVQCPLCDQFTYAGDNGWVSWNHRMEHVAQHHDSGETLRTSRPEFQLFDHLWQKRLIDDEDLRELKEGNHNLVRPPARLNVLNTHENMSQHGRYPLQHVGRSEFQTESLLMESRGTPHPQALNFEGPDFEAMIPAPSSWDMMLPSTIGSLSSLSVHPSPPPSSDDRIEKE